MARCGSPLTAVGMMETMLPNAEPKTNAGLDALEKFKKNKIHIPEPSNQHLQEWRSKKLCFENNENSHDQS